MLIRSSPVVLERKRVPVGPLRVNYDNPLTEGLVGFWLFNAQNAGVDLTQRSPDLTWQGAAELRGGVEGIGLDCSGSTTSGARLLFSNASPLADLTGPGLSIFARAQTLDGTPTIYGNIFGLHPQNVASPFLILGIGRHSTADRAFWWRNSAGTYIDSTSNAGVAGSFTANRPTSLVHSLTFGVAANGYTAGTNIYNHTSSVAAPTVSASDNVLAFGYDGVNSRNAQVIIFAGGVWNRDLSAADAQFLESEPYSLVEPVRSWAPVYFPASAPPPPPPPSSLLPKLIQYGAYL